MCGGGVMCVVVVEVMVCVVVRMVCVVIEVMVCVLVRVVCVMVEVIWCIGDGGDVCGG